MNYPNTLDWLGERAEVNQAAGASMITPATPQEDTPHE